MRLEPRAALICLDLQRYRNGLGLEADRLDACRKLLEAARARRWPVLHVHHRPAAGDPRPLPGLEPRANEPVFLRRGPSAFSSPAFAEAAQRLGGPLALVGFSLRDTALATALAAADRGLPVEAPLDCLCTGGPDDPGARRALVGALEAAGPGVRVTDLKDLLQPEAGRLAAANAP